MNTSEIEVLLEKFYDGNTSLQEEKILREFFMAQDVPEHLRIHQPLFAFYETEGKNEVAGNEFDHKLFSEFDGKQDKPLIVPFNPVRRGFMYVSAIAASLLILSGLLFLFQGDLFRQTLSQKSSLETEIAYADASRALLMVSGNLNHGLKQAENLQLVEKAFQNMELFNKFYQYQPIIINPDEMSNRSTKTK
jgi:hypothetical protein